MLTVTTLLPRGRMDSVSDDALQVDSPREQKSEEAVFHCPSLLHLQTWHSLVVVVSKTMRSRAKVTVYVDSVNVGSDKVGRKNL